MEERGRFLALALRPTEPCVRRNRTIEMRRLTNQRLSEALPLGEARGTVSYGSQ